MVIYHSYVSFDLPFENSGSFQSRVSLPKGNNRSPHLFGAETRLRYLVAKFCEMHICMVQSH